MYCTIQNEHSAHINYVDDLVIQKRKVCFCCLCSSTCAIMLKVMPVFFFQSCVQNINGGVPLVLCLLSQLFMNEH